LDFQLRLSGKERRSQRLQTPSDSEQPYKSAPRSNVSTASPPALHLRSRRDAGPRPSAGTH
jgi:hypothetical protein